MKILIISDKRAGHLNQSIAFAKYLNAEVKILEANFKYKFFKNLSYILDFFRIYTQAIFDIKIKDFSSFDYVVSAGSSTYYLNKLISKKFNLKSVALMLPRGFRYDFNYIFAQVHDNAPKKNNIIVMDSNFSFSEPSGIYKKEKKSVGIIIGGKNSVYEMNTSEIKRYLDTIFSIFKDYEIAVTTSPRTSKEVEELVSSYDFAYSVIFSKNRINPIADFLTECEYVFITADSTSMISEAVSNANANIEVLPLKSMQKNKFDTFVNNLSEKGYLHVFDDNVSDKNKKIDCQFYAQKINE